MVASVGNGTGSGSVLGATIQQQIKQQQALQQQIQQQQQQSSTSAHQQQQATQQQVTSNVIYPAAALANLPQDVLMSLLQTGQIQLHNEGEFKNYFFSLHGVMNSPGNLGISWKILYSLDIFLLLVLINIQQQIV